MDATIYRENGTLVIDFRKPVQRISMYRNVEVSTCASDTITVTGDKTNWEYALSNWCEDFDLTDKDNMELVLPEYIEEYDTEVLSWWERPIGREGRKWKKSRREKRIKPGWFEFKNTNIPSVFITTKYIIYR